MAAIDNIENRIWKLGKIYSKTLKNTWSPQRRDASDRGVLSGSSNPDDGRSDTIQYVQITTTGNTADFGNLTHEVYASGGCGSSTRGINAGGFVAPSPGMSNVIDYITYSSLGNATDFGDLTTTRETAGCANQTRAVFGGGYQGPSPVNVTNTMDYIEIASTGDAVDFGDLVEATRGGLATFASTTKGFVSKQNIGNQFNFATLGNAKDWGDADVEESFSNWVNSAGFSNRHTGFHAGGITPSMTNSIHSISTIHAGNGTDFGNLTVARQYLAGFSNFTRGCAAGGSAPSLTNVID